MSQISFAVVIPSYNEEENISQVLAAVAKNRVNVGDVDVVVVDNLSTDATVAKAREAGCAVLENETGCGLTISESRNRGVRATRGDVLAFLDADMIVPPDWLAKAAARFESGFQGALGFVDTVPDDAGWVARTWGMRALQQSRQERAVDYLPARNLLINRTVFDALGGFDESLRTNEDKDLTFRIARAGYAVLQIPQPVLLHLGYEKDLAEFIRKEFWRQSSTLGFARKHDFTWRTLRNPILSLAHLLSLVVALFCLLAGSGAAASLFLLVWLLPSASIAWLGRGLEAPAGYSWKLFVLTLLRWNVSGFALANQLIHGEIGFSRRRG